VFVVAVDGNDHVWAGTWGGGVSRFDGESWTSYSSEDGLPGNIVYSVLIDRDGHYWFGTNRGLVIFDGKKWARLGAAIGIEETDVYALSQDRNGHVWAGFRGAVVRVEKVTQG
jgi:ligand-binding sensor domain-containing protein